MGAESGLHLTSIFDGSSWCVVLTWTKEVYSKMNAQDESMIHRAVNIITAASTAEEMMSEADDTSPHPPPESASATLVLRPLLSAGCPSCPKGNAQSLNRICRRRRQMTRSSSSFSHQPRPTSPRCEPLTSERSLKLLARSNAKRAELHWHESEL